MMFAVIGHNHHLQVMYCTVINSVYTLVCLVLFVKEAFPNLMNMQWCPATPLRGLSDQQNKLYRLNILLRIPEVAGGSAVSNVQT